VQSLQPDHTLAIVPHLAVQDLTWLLGSLINGLLSLYLSVIGSVLQRQGHILEHYAIQHHWLFVDWVVAQQTLQRALLALTYIVELLHELLVVFLDLNNFLSIHELVAFEFIRHNSQLQQFIFLINNFELPFLFLLENLLDVLELLLVKFVVSRSGS
jgi:hypothetical protein